MSIASFQNRFSMHDDDKGPLGLTPFHFLKLVDGKPILWDYSKHSQFELSADHLHRLLEISGRAALTDDRVDQEILASGVLVDAHEVHDGWGWDWLAHIFHYGTCHPLQPTSVNQDVAADYAKSYVEFCESIAEDSPDPELNKGGDLIDLPAPDLAAFQNTSFWDVLKRRRTCRDFDRGAVSVQLVTNCLYVAFGSQPFTDPTAPPGIEEFGYKRTSPAAGGLQSTEAYLWAINVDGLQSGIYHYLPHKHQLECIQPALPDVSLGTYLCNQTWADDMAFAVLMTSRFDKMWWKYPHSRAYRPMLMELGHFSQTLNLAITASGLHPWMTGYFHDKELAALLHCDPVTEHPLLLVGGGTGSGSPYDRATRALFEARSREEQ